MTTSSGFSFSMRPQISSTYVVFCRQIDIILRDFQAGRTQLDLTDGLFARDIQHRVLVGDGTAELQQHRRFAHARLTAQQYDAAQHDAAA